MPSSADFGMNDKNYSDDSGESDAELLNNATWNGNNNPVIQKNKDPHRRLSLNNLVGRMNQKKIDPFFEPKVLRKNNSITRTESIGSLAKESKVLVIYTGGTIGMVKNSNGGTYSIFKCNVRLIHLSFQSTSLVPELLANPSKSILSCTTKSTSRGLSRCLNRRIF